MSELYHFQQLPLFVTSKVCNSCHIEQELDAFPKDPRYKNGLKTECRSCANMRHRRYHALKRQTLLACPIIGTKVCKECSVEKSLEEFPISVTCKDRHESICKACKAQRTKEYEQRNKNRISERRKMQHRADPERKNRHEREKYAQDIEKSRKYNREKRVKYRERNRQYASDYYETHADYYAEKRKKWEAINREKRREIKTRRRAIQRGVIVGEVCFERILERDGLTCYICEKPILPHHKMHFDHVIPLTRKGPHTEENIKVSHGVCNDRKGSKLLSEMTPYQRRGVS